MQDDHVALDAAEHIGTAVAWGRADCLAIVESTLEYLHGQGEPDELRALAWRLIGPRFEAQLRAQEAWPARTDNDRLTDAFRVLDAAGIVAREDFTCCQNCGTDEIDDEVVESATARGYVFYHFQDAERAAQGGSLWLAYGLLDESDDDESDDDESDDDESDDDESGDDDEARTVAVGEEIAAALRAEGLDVDWDGSAGQRINVRLTWARRRHGRMAAFVSDPAGPDVTLKVTKGRFPLAPQLPVTVFTQLVLPWLPDHVSVRVGQGDEAVRVHRKHQRLVSGDRRTVGRFDGLRLLEGGGDGDVPDEPGLLDVSFECLPSGPAEGASRPMVLPELLDVLRRLPTRTGSWLSAISGTGGIVQVRWEDGRLWLETPHPADGSSTGKHASLDEAIRMLTILATEDRVAIAELEGAVTKPWR